MSHASIPARATTYNGWANYATWRVNLEFFGNGETLDDMGFRRSNLPQQLRDFVEEIVCDGATGVARDYALAFLSDVDWHEIAEHMIEEEDIEAAYQAEQD